MQHASTLNILPINHNTKYFCQIQN